MSHHTRRAHAQRLLGGVGTGVSLCPSCELVFTSVSAFDAHQRSDPTDPGRVWCIRPGDAGLELKPSGRWGTPAKLCDMCRQHVRACRCGG